MNVQCKVAIAEPEPVGCADLAELLEGVPGFSRETPAALAVAKISEGIEQGVVVWADGETVQLKIVAWVRDDREVTSRECGTQAVGELRPANAPCEECDARAHAFSAGSTSRPKAAAHSVWLRPTLCR